MLLLEILRTDWFENLPEEIRVLLAETIDLIEVAKQQERPRDDYSFLVFGAAKAYEGYLKHYFFQMNMIGKRELMDDHFRIGKSLNPDLPESYRGQDWLYDQVKQVCGEEVVDFLWQAWREGRNRVFHFHFDESNVLTLNEAEARVKTIILAIEKAEKCGVRAKFDEIETEGIQS